MTPSLAPRLRGSNPTQAFAATALALLVALLTVALTMVSAPRAGAQGVEAAAATTATLTIHNRLCPAGFTGPDYFGTCHGTPAPAGLQFVAEGPEVVDAFNDAAGNAVFTDLTPGTYSVRGGVPLDFATLFIACTPAATPGTPYPFTPRPAGGASSTTGAQITLAAGANIVCDFYNTPVPQGPQTASLTIRGRLCPTGYTGSNFFTDCTTLVPAELDYTITGPQTVTIIAGVSGNVTFSDLTPGTYTVRGGVPGEFAVLVVACTGANPPYPAVPFTPLLGGVRGPNDVTGISIALGIGAEVVCSFYNIPEDLSGASPSPSAKPSAAPSAKPSTSAAPVTGLPNTGAGTRVQGADTSTLVLLAIAVVAVAGLGLAARRRNAA